MTFISAFFCKGGVISIQYFLCSNWSPDHLLPQFSALQVINGGFNHTKQVPGLFYFSGYHESCHACSSRPSGRCTNIGQLPSVASFTLRGWRAVFFLRKRSSNQRSTCPASLPAPGVGKGKRQSGCRSQGAELEGRGRAIRARLLGLGAEHEDRYSRLLAGADS